MCQHVITEPLIVGFKDVADPYMSGGSHPEIVVPVWDELGKNLTREGRFVVCGTPVLVRAP
ncbi:MAG: hypothetical protein ACXV2C_02135 [Candidatus Bathyarchaeia archaeon]